MACVLRCAMDLGFDERVKWHVFWLDERVVPKTQEDINYKLAFDGFLSKVCHVLLPMFLFFFFSCQIIKL